ncbi:Protein Y49F6B.2 [Aphelenchoides avenae]|nr:Protein Y49F6B.2 [Aphelenchus avenae]
MKRAAIQPGFDQKSHSEVAPKSFRGAKRQRKAEREKTKGTEWYDLPATEMTEERRRDLELVQMRDALDSKTHYRRNDRDVLPKYFQIGKVIETKADYYSSRVVKKQRKRTMVEELLADHEVVAKNKRRYDKIMAREAITKRGAFQRKGFISKRSKRKKGTTAE